ncbi:hypothetical protein JTB14_018754 [Gonioctena quinquepunctata]|nr:hypothetical protein JTB14_018754 [Gonioctena quinquepunctata]
MPKAEDQCQKSEDIFVEVYSDEARKENITEETNEVQWAKYTPDILKRKKAKALTQARNNNENQISTKISQWASVKAALEEEKKKLLDEEYKTKIQLLRETQQVELDILKKESDVKIAKMEEEKKVIIEGLKEEHRLKKEILELQKIQILEDLRT